MKAQWKKLMSLVMVLVAAITMTGCSVLLELLDEDTQSRQSTTVARQTTTAAKPGTAATTRPATKPATQASTQTSEANPELAAIPVKEDGAYSTKMEVAAYLYQYGHLPDNYLTKEEARDLGWVAEKSNLWKVTDRMSIGGDRFGNYEGLLPKKSGRQYYEADIDYRGGGRNAKRIVFSNDGLIFYTDDHYESFERLN